MATSSGPTAAPAAPAAAAPPPAPTSTSSRSSSSVCSVVDASADDATAAQQLRQACIQSGFFHLVHHGVPEALREAAFEQMRAAFALPAASKAALLADENNRGWTPFAEETLDPQHQSRGDTKEGFYFGREVPADDPEASLPLHGPNQWPSEQELPEFRHVITQYYDALLALGHRLLRLLALSLGLPGGHFDAAFVRPIASLRPLHYSAEVSAPADGVYGCGAHSDYGMLTILATDGTPGLQVHLDDVWHDVEPLPGAFIINLGDMLERWTNGLYRSTLHRVVNTSGRERYSCAFFFEPNFHAIVEALPCCVTPARPAAWPPTTAGQHLLAKYAATHEGYDSGKKAARLQQQQQQQQEGGGEQQQHKQQQLEQHKQQQEQPDGPAS